jgi:hypothetical protein
MGRAKGKGRRAGRCVGAWGAVLVTSVWAASASAQVPECLVVEARSAPSGNGRYDHSLTFVNECNVRMFLNARYSDAPDAAASSDVVQKGETITMTLGLYQPTKTFRAHYDVRFGRGAEARPAPKPATATVRSTTPRAARPARSLASSPALTRSLSLADLCDRALRKLFKLQGLSDETSLSDRVENCPSRVKRDPEKRRAELECVLGADTRENVRVCFKAK